MAPCINENESLFDLIHKKNEITNGMKNGSVPLCSGTMQIKEINQKIKTLENAAKTKGACIRLM